MVKFSRYLFGLFVIGAVILLNLPSQAAWYGRKIIVPEAENARLKAAVGDLQSAL